MDRWREKYLTQLEQTGRAELRLTPAEYQELLAEVRETSRDPINHYAPIPGTPGAIMDLLLAIPVIIEYPPGVIDIEVAP